MKILFINSFQRSGSTLLGVLLGLHPAVRYLGEVRNAFPSKGRTMLETESLLTSVFWRSAFAKLARSAPEMTTDTGSELSESRCFENIRDIYRACAESCHETWLVDSSHRTREAKSHLIAMGDGVRVLYLLRDGRAVLHSALKRKGGKSTTLASLEILYWWNRFHIGAKALHLRVPREQLLTLRYEDLCARPMGTLNRVASFLGEQPFPRSAFCQKTCRPFIGGSSTFIGVGHGLSNLREDRSWEDGLPRAARRLFRFLGRPMNGYLGY